mgnify:FL=1
MSEQHEFLTFWKKFVHVYEVFCSSACKKHQMNQNSYDLILFLSNNPALNTAKDICEIRGVKKGIISVTIDRLVSEGYLLRENDPNDRRIQRLFLTKKSDPIVADGRLMQKQYFAAITAGLSEEELDLFETVTKKMKQNIIKLEREL